MWEVPEEERQRPHVVLVTVGDDHQFHIGCTGSQRIPIRQDQVDAMMLGVGKRQPDIEHGNAAVNLDGRHIGTDLTKAAEEADLDRL